MPKIFFRAILATAVLSTVNGAAIADGGHSHQPTAMVLHDDPGSTVAVGALEISEAFTRVTPLSATAARAFLQVTNKGTDTDRLIAASSPAAARVVVHEMKMQEKSMKMVEVAGGMEVAGGEILSLSAGGFHHLMFIDIKAAFVEGDKIPVTLTFGRAGTVDLHLPVGDDHAGHNH